MQFTPSPGIVFVEPIEDEATGLKLTDSPKGQIKCGKVLGVGSSVTDCEPPEAYCKVGDIIYFLNYEGEYDMLEYNNKRYFVVKFGDIRGVRHGK